MVPPAKELVHLARAVVPAQVSGVLCVLQVYGEDWAMTEMTMVERVAKAIYTKNANRSVNQNVLSWGQIPPSHRQFWCECAAAGIAEMRDPTEAMLQADPRRDSVLSQESWEAMVDAALKEQEGEKG